MRLLQGLPVPTNRTSPEYWVLECGWQDDQGIIRRCGSRYCLLGLGLAVGVLLVVMQRAGRGE